ncbi:MAG: hypothetical protein ACRD3B_01270 [Candidatus Sulfotelmatobacter sp.]
MFRRTTRFFPDRGAHGNFDFGEAVKDIWLAAGNASYGAFEALPSGDGDQPNGFIGPLL